jgi:hypothetical protein
MKKALLSTVAMIVFGLPSAFAGNIAWNLVGATSQLLGTTDTVISTTGNISMAFSGYYTNTTDVASNGAWSPTTAKATNLYAKNSGGDEIGLGIAADPSGENEIVKNSFVQVDLAGLLANKTITAFNLIIGSVQSNEGFNIWGSNSAGQPGTLLYTGTSAMDDVSFAVPSYGTYRYVSISASAHNILLDSVTASNLVPAGATPEPGTLVLGCIAGLGLLARRLFQ